MAMTAQAQVQGGAILGAAGADGAVIHFLGIPFAAPPIAGLRWRPPEPATPWQGVLETLHAAPAGPQPLPPPSSFYQKEFFRRSDAGRSPHCRASRERVGAAKRNPIRCHCACPNISAISDREIAGKGAVPAAVLRL